MNAPISVIQYKKTSLHYLKGATPVVVEARQYPRYKFIATAVITKSNDMPTQISSLAANISRKGLRLHSYRPFDIGTEIEIDLIFRTRTGDRTKETVLGTITRISRMANFYVLGVSLDEEIMPDKNPVLHKYYSKGSFYHISM